MRDEQLLRVGQVFIAIAFVVAVLGLARLLWDWAQYLVPMM